MAGRTGSDRHVPKQNFSYPENHLTIKPHLHLFSVFIAAFGALTIAGEAMSQTAMEIELSKEDALFVRSILQRHELMLAMIKSQQDISSLHATAAKERDGIEALDCLQKLQPTGWHSFCSRAHSLQHVLFNYS